MITPLRHARDFERLGRAGRRFRRGPLIVRALCDDDLFDTRLAYSIRRGHGSAVRRNRTRRRLRAACHELDSAGSVPNGWYLISVRDDSGDVDFSEWRSLLKAAFDDLKGLEES